MICRLLTVFAFAVLCCIATDVTAAELRAGAATSNITPEIGLPIIGGFVPYPSENIHDELHARCLVLDDGQTQLAIVVCDLLGFHRAVSEEARRLIQEKTGIPLEHVFISATHTHSAASALGNRNEPDAVELDEYQQFVARRIADGVVRARHLLRPAELGYGSVDVPQHLFNRRWFMRAGSMPPNPFGTLDLVKMNPPAGSDALLDPAGPTDPEVSIVAVRETGGKMISVFAAYSLHYVGGVNGTDISADYYGEFCSHLSTLLEADRQDPPFVAMLANGTSGDINNINFREPRGQRQPYEQIRYVAHDVAQHVVDALAAVEYKSDISLAAAYREPVIGWRQLTDAEREWAIETHARGPESESDIAYIYSERMLGMLEYPETTTVPIQVLRLGDVCIGTLPCEVFCEIGLEFKERCPQQPAFMVELNHGYFGYLPTPRQHDFGGYETWPGTNRLERDASTKLMEQLLEMAAELEASR